jgi:hypothetical protein
MVEIVSEAASFERKKCRTKVCFHAKAHSANLAGNVKQPFGFFQNKITQKVFPQQNDFTVGIKPRR